MPVPAVATIWGIPIERIPEPLQAALVVAFEREWTGDSMTFRPSPLLHALLDLCARWRARAAMQGRRFDGE
jgi:hypothetical protein